ncbi:MAG: hypothetical protein PHE56_03510 [Bacteroidales bacterium]|nr:hypothetical protein [Bacteroidales bacterium]
MKKKIKNISFAVLIIIFVVSCHTSVLQNNKKFHNNREKIILKKNGVFRESAFQSGFSNHPRKYWGKWNINGDTLVLLYNQYGLVNNRTLKFLLDENFTTIYRLDSTLLYYEVVKTK